MRHAFISAIVLAVLAFGSQSANGKTQSIADCSPYNVKHTQFSCIDQDGHMVLLGAIGHAHQPSTGIIQIVGKGKIRDRSGRLYRIR